MPRTAPLLLSLLSLAAAGCHRNAVPAMAKVPSDASTRDAVAALPADYDPIALVDKGADPVKVYLAEPRREAWAMAVENAIGGQMRRDLKKIVPEAHNLSLGCRTLGCLILIDAPADKMEAAATVATLVTMGPITSSLGLTPDGHAQLLFLTDRRMREPAEFIGWYRRIRKSTYDAIRAGKQPNPFSVPVGELPTD